MDTKSLVLELLLEFAQNGIIFKQTSDPAICFRRIMKEPFRGNQIRQGESRIEFVKRIFQGDYNIDSSIFVQLIMQLVLQIVPFDKQGYIVFIVPIDRLSKQRLEEYQPSSICYFGPSDCKLFELLQTSTIPFKGTWLMQIAKHEYLGLDPKIQIHSLAKWGEIFDYKLRHFSKVEENNQFYTIDNPPNLEYFILNILRDSSTTGVPIEANDLVQAILKCHYLTNEKVEFAIKRFF